MIGRASSNIFMFSLAREFLEDKYFSNFEFGAIEEDGNCLEYLESGVNIESTELGPKLDW